MRMLLCISALLLAHGSSAEGPSPRATINEYIEACRVGDASRLEAIFHDEAVMSGYYDGDFYIGSPGVFFDEVRDNPSPAATGNPYSAQITVVDKSAGIATVVMQEQGYLGDDYTNMFQLALIDGKWLIVSKIYQDLDP